MRARELLQENYAENLKIDLGNLLIGAKAVGSTEISTDDIVQQLYAMGYSVSVNSVLSLLAGNSLIVNATPEMITLGGDEMAVSDSDSGDDQDSAARVKDMAQQASGLS